MECPIKKSAPISAPETLSERSKSLWGEIVPRRAESPERLALLQSGLEALDTADRARATLLAEGETFTTKTTGAIHVHPAVRIQKDALSHFLAVWRELDLKWSYQIDGQAGP